MNERLYSSAERELVYRWGEKWFELLFLINGVISTAEPPQAIHELKYQDLRSWLMDHRGLFMPLWEDFYKFWKSRQGLTNEVTGNISKSPLELPELPYQNRHSSYLDRHEQYGDLWRDTFAYWDATPDHSAHDALSLDSRYDEDPLLFFYEPENLYRLAYQLALQGQTDVWQPSEARARDVRPLLVRTGQIMVQFEDWIDD